jgi:hypothetical protein
VFLVLAGCSSTPPPPAAIVFPSKINEFYASPPQVPKGQRTLLCYGVESAESVTLDPGGESLSPALNKCIEKFPTADTTYTLTVKGKDGQTHTRTLAITSGIVPLKILDIVVSATQVKPGEMVSLCFKAQGAVGVSGGPGKFQKGGQPNGDCLMDQPQKTTSYKILISGAGNQFQSDSVTVKVSP